jgi:two-component system, chemotaxis family, chemotaxis protein CheY
MSYKVLIVDDALFMRAMLREILVTGGYEVVGEASNGMDALQQYRLLQPDLVTMDIVMPLRSGIEALQDITAEDPQARVVMCTALGQESLLAEATAAGACGYIIKPFREQEVLSVLEQVFATTPKS